MKRVAPLALLLASCTGEPPMRDGPGEIVRGAILPLSEEQQLDGSGSNSPHRSREIYRLRWVAAERAARYRSCDRVFFSEVASDRTRAEGRLNILVICENGNRWYFPESRLSEIHDSNKPRILP